MYYCGQSSSLLEWRPLRTADKGYVLSYGCRPKSVNTDLGCGLRWTSPCQWGTAPL